MAVGSRVNARTGQDHWSFCIEQLLAKRMDAISEIGDCVGRRAQMIRFISQVHFQANNANARLLLMNSVLETEIEQGSF